GMGRRSLPSSHSQTSRRERLRPKEAPARQEPNPAVPSNAGALRDQIKPDLDAGLTLNLKDKSGRCRVCGAPFMGPGKPKILQRAQPLDQVSRQGITRATLRPSVSVRPAI